MGQKLGVGVDTERPSEHTQGPHQTKDRQEMGCGCLQEDGRLHVLGTIW